MSAEPAIGDPGHGLAAEPAVHRWQDAAARLDYAERHGATQDELERLADEVTEARVAMFQAGVSRTWRLPDFLQGALNPDRPISPSEF